MAISGKLTKKLVENLGQGRHSDGGGLYLVVDPSGARRWIVRVVVKGQRNAKGAPLRTDFGLGGAYMVTLNQARDRALEYRRMAKQGLNPRFNAQREIPTFAEIAQQVHIDRMPTWKNAKHGQQWINTLRDYAFPKIGRIHAAILRLVLVERALVEPVLAAHLRRRHPGFLLFDHPNDLGFHETALSHSFAPSKG